MNAPTSQAVLAPTVKLLIGGQFVESKTTEWRDVVNPATQEVLARVPFATQDEINAAVASAKEAFKTWKKTPIGTRARIFLKYQQLIQFLTIKRHHGQRRRFFHRIRISSCDKVTPQAAHVIDE